MTTRSQLNQTPARAAAHRLPAGSTRRPVRAALALLLLAVVLLLALLASVLIGSVSIPLDQIGRVLLGDEVERAAWRTIVLDFRLPKAVTAMLAGGALGMAGLLMQTLFRNPLADPFVLGVSSGASLGVGIAILTGGSALAALGLIGDVAIITAASLGAGAALALILLAARVVAAEGGGTASLLILGVMFAYLTGAAVSLLSHFAVPERLQQFSNWSQGSFGGVTWTQLPPLAVVLCGGALLALLAIKPLNVLLLGERYAASMGIHVRRARVHILAASALLAGAVTAFCGPIGFLGIAAPHLCRPLLRSSNHALLLPACALAGAALALLADVVAQVPGSTLILPLNAVLSVVGAPIVIAFLLRQHLRSHP